MRTSASTQEKLLEAGRTALDEKGPCSPVRSIRLTDALRRANLTVGAAYRIWDCQDEFFRELDLWVARHDLERFDKALAGIRLLDFDSLVGVFAHTFSRSFVGQCGVAAHNDELGAALTQRHDRLRQAVFDCLERARPQGPPRGHGASDLAGLIVMLFQGFAITLARLPEFEERLDAARKFAASLDSLLSMNTRRDLEIAITSDEVSYA